MVILSAGYTMQYTDHVLQKCTLETYTTLLTKVTSVNLKKKKKFQNESFAFVFTVGKSLLIQIL